MAKTPKVELVPHLSSDDLKQRYRTSSDAKTARRWQALWLASSGMPIHTIAQVVGLHRNWIRQIIKRYNADGSDAVIDHHQHHPGGRAPALTTEQQHALTAALHARPADGGRWTGPKVAAWIKHVTKRSQVSPQLGWTYLRKLGYTLQIPRPQHPKAATLDEQTAWKKT